MPHFMIVLIPYINLLNLSWILRNMEPSSSQSKKVGVSAVAIFFFFFFLSLLSLLFCTVTCIILTLSQLSFWFHISEEHFLDLLFFLQMK